LVKAGRLKALGVTSAKRMQSLPDIPAIAETLPGYESDSWQGVLMPKGTPSAIVGSSQPRNREDHPQSDVVESALRVKAPNWSPARRLNSAPTSKPKLQKTRN
jgi:hypothetical protein